MTYGKRLTIAVLITCILLLVVISPLIVWRFTAVRPVNVVIIDKTVPKPTYREHKALMWVLNNLKYENKQTMRAFEFNQDYYGFFPLDNHQYSIRALPSNLEHVDLIYLADMYGVYTKDFYEENIRGERSQLIYGGAEPREIEVIEHLLDKSALLIGEFNTFATPTDKKTHAMLENLFGVKWSGWIGRYFTDLDENNEEVPIWLIRNYETQYKSKWNFKGPGFGFVRVDDTVLVLKEGEESGKEVIKVVFTEKAEKEFKVKNNVRYYYWFDVLLPGENAEVLAYYKLDLTDRGKKMLEDAGIKDTFPTVVRTVSPYRTYYLAGDFSDVKRVPSYWNAAFLNHLMARVYRDVEGSQTYFFWNVYYPLIENILKHELHSRGT